MNETNQFVQIPPADIAGQAQMASEFIETIDPVVIPDPYGWVPYAIVLGILLLLALAGMVWWKKFRQHHDSEPTDTMSPQQKALLRLKKALALESNPRSFIFEVSDALRVFIDEQFHIAAPGQTTEEFMDFVRHDTRLHPDHKMLLDKFLTTSDLIKFARFEPGHASLMELHDSARSFIEQTASPEESAPSHEGNDPTDSKEAPL